jgi:hypothetical protein
MNAHYRLLLAGNVIAEFHGYNGLDMLTSLIDNGLPVGTMIERQLRAGQWVDMLHIEAHEEFRAASKGE